ncbi:MAG: lysostaphin resistance A-like protein [Gemmatimonadaceae bacterium]
MAESGALRAPWRIALFAVILVLTYLASVGLAGPIIAPVLRLIGDDGMANESWISVIALIAATWICIRFVDKRPWSDVWLDRAAARPKWLAIGFGVGTLAIGLPIVALIAGGWLRSASAAPGSWWGACVRVSVLLVPAALTEELFTRGYILSVLRGSVGWPFAIAGTSVGFGLLHWRNPGATLGSVTLVTLAGFFLAAILYTTRSLYAAWMAHFAWNWTMAALFHVSVSGFPLESPTYRYVDAGPDWATGGPWGPEGGLPAAAGMAGGIALLVSRRRVWSSHSENSVQENT